MKFSILNPTWTVFVRRFACGGAKHPVRVRACGMISVRTSSDQALQLFRHCQKPLPQIWRCSARKAQTDDWFHVLLNYDRLRVILHGSVVVAGGTPRMAIHGTGGSWLKYGLDVQEEQLISGMIPGQPGWGQDPRPALFYNGREANRWNSLYPPAISVSTISEFAMPFATKEQIRSPPHRRSQ